MNERLRRIKEEEENSRGQRKALNRTSIFGILLCIVVAIVASGVIGVQKKQEIPKTSQEQEEPWAEVSAESVSSTAASETPVPVELPWELLVVNKVQRQPRTYTLRLRAVNEEETVDERIYEPLAEMVAAAERDGVVLTVCSGYRNVKTQDVLFTDKVKEWLVQGLGEEAAVAEASKYLQPPGASEHHTGLAVDFLTSDYSTLDSGFAKTAAYRWLTAHAAEYGFIERYPQDKEAETGVLWESWHYRYVGTAYAKEIQAEKLCLEEFVTAYRSKAQAGAAG